MCGPEVRSFPVVFEHAFTNRAKDDEDSKFVCDELQTSVHLYRLQFASSSSDEAFEWIQNSINDCLRNHKACKKGFPGTPLDRKPPVLPTRVIDVGPSGSSTPPKIFETRRARGHYIALSHCWGEEHQPLLKTTREDIDRFQIEMPVTEIPKTYMDTFFIASRLGIRYVWIDSLCIIQDDDKDWAQESAAMGDIYHDSHVTICACASKHCNDDLFFTREKIPMVEIPFSNTGDLTRPRSYFITESATALGDDVEDIYASHHFRYPDLGLLRTRAWITQEWALPPRLLCFRRGSIIWICRSQSKREDGRPVGDGHIRGLPGRTDLSGAKRCYEGWLDIVEEYCKRKLTLKKDKLIAIQGLIGQMARSADVKDTCTYGLWKKRLAAELAWRRDDDCMKLECPPDLEREGIPSWSWASKINAIRYYPRIDMDSKEPGISLLSGETDDGRWLHLQAFCRIVDVVKRVGSEYTVQAAAKHEVVSLYFDDGIKGHDSQHVALLNLGVSKPLADKWIDAKGTQRTKLVRSRVFLILNPLNDGEGRYERIGAGVQRHAENGLFQSWTQKEISIG